MPQLDTSTYASLIFWLFLSFGFVYLALHFLIMPKMQGILKQRQSYIDSQKHSLTVLLNSIQEVDEEINKKIQDIRAKSDSLFSEEEKRLKTLFFEKNQWWDKHISEKEEELRLKLQEDQKEFLLHFEKEVPYLSELFLKKLDRPLEKRKKNLTDKRHKAESVE